MTKVPAKICGLNEPRAVTAAVEGGAAMVGFVFFRRSPRFVTADQAAALAANRAVPEFGPGDTVRVAVKVRPGRQWDAEQQLRLRLKQAFDAAGADVAFGRKVVYFRSDSGGGSLDK